MSADEQVFVLTIASDKRCEFSIDYYQLVLSLRQAGIIDTGGNGARHSIRVAGESVGIGLTEKGRKVAENLSAQLNDMTGV